VKADNQAQHPDQKTMAKSPQKGVPPSAVDHGGWAEHYASRPYANSKFEVYPLFTDILACLSEGIRVLDIGAGPGHLAYEFFKRHPKSDVRFVLLDSSIKLLEIAASRLKRRGSQVKTAYRSYQMTGWEQGLGKFDAIVSNNTPYPTDLRELGRFYRACFERLKKNGILLFQQPFSYAEGKPPYGSNPLSDFLRQLPSEILPSHPRLTKREQARLETEKREATARHRKAIAEAEASGVVFPKETGWQFLTVPEHLVSLRSAGFEAGCIWRKRESAVLLGVKGQPKVRIR